MKQPIALFLFALAAALPVQAQLLAPATPASSGPLDRIAAVVNEDVILQSELDDAVRSVQQQYANQPGQLPPLDVLRRQVLERLVLMKLQVQRAQDQDIRISSAEVDQAVAGVAAQNNMSPDQLRGEVQRSGLDFGQFRQQLAEQLTVQRLHQAVVRDSVAVTDSEVDNLMSSPTYKSGEIHLAHIQISTPSAPDAAAIQAAQTKAEQALAAIHGGLDFNAAAIRFSDASDALEGGDLGWRRMDDIPPAFADTVENMKPGDISPALRGPTGFHILKLVDQRQASRQMVTEFHARQIMIKPSELVSAAQAEQKIRSLYQQITEKNGDFAALAKENSKDDTTANAGGDMGWFKQQDWGVAIGQQIAALQDSEVSQPFKTEMGWHILQRLGTRETDQTEQIARDEARQAIGNRKAEQAYDDFLRDLRSNAFVDILIPELRDTDAQAAVTTP